MEAADIEQLIAKAIPDADVAVKTPDNTHFFATIVAPGFDGKNRIQRHQQVYAALGGYVGDEIHALSIQALTPDEQGE